MKLWNKIRNFFSKKKEEPLIPKPNPHVQKIYDWVMGLKEDNILIIKSEYSAPKYDNNTEILKTFFHISQKNNLTGDEGCGRRVSVKRVKKTFINEISGNGYIDISYYLTSVGKWEEELNEEQLKCQNIIEDNSGAIKCIFERAFHIHSERKEEMDSKKEEAYISEIENSCKTSDFKKEKELL